MPHYSISAPLIVDGNVIGLFSGMSDDLTKYDTPTRTAFEDQKAVVFRISGLMVEMEVSLTEVVQEREGILENQETLQMTLDGTANAMATSAERSGPFTTSH